MDERLAINKKMTPLIFFVQKSSGKRTPTILFSHDRLRQPVLVNDQQWPRHFDCNLVAK